MEEVKERRTMGVLAGGGIGGDRSAARGTVIRAKRNRPVAVATERLAVEVRRERELEGEQIVGHRLASERWSLVGEGRGRPSPVGDAY